MYASKETDLVNTHTAGQSHGASVVSGTRSTPLAQHLVSVAVLGLLLMPGALPSKHETCSQFDKFEVIVVKLIIQKTTQTHIIVKNNNSSVPSL